MTLHKYLNHTILPIYDTYDKGHNRTHILDVVNGVYELAQLFPNVNIEMLHTAAIFHDIGIPQGRDTHHLTSAKLLRQDSFINTYFSPDDVETIAQAIEDHRASSPIPPRTIYGEILSSADRIIDTNTIIIRSYYHNEKHYPDLSIDDNIELIHKHITAKYGHGGYLTIPIITQRNQLGLDQLRALLSDSDYFKTYCRKHILDTIKP